MDLTTQKSLLARLKDGPGERDWELFYEKYWAVILNFAHKQGLDEHGARDVLQETMLVLMRKLPEFSYDPKCGHFRNWLLTIVANKAREAMRRSRSGSLVSLDGPRSGSGVALAERLAADGPMAADAVEASWQQSLLEEAFRRLRDDPQTKPETFEVFQAYAVEGRPVAEVAARFGLKQNAVYQIKNRLMQRLRDEMVELEQASGTSNQKTDASA